MSGQSPNPPTRRRDLMRPTQLLGLSLIAALFAGLATLMGMGFFQRDHTTSETMDALNVALIAGGCTFIGTAITIALILLIVQPAEITHVVKTPVLLAEDKVAAELKAARDAADAAKAAAAAAQVERGDHGTPQDPGAGGGRSPRH